MLLVDGTNNIFTKKWKRQIGLFFFHQLLISVSWQLLGEKYTFAMLKLFPSAEMKTISGYETQKNNVLNKPQTLM